MRNFFLPLALLITASGFAQEPGPDPCEALLVASTDRPAWPGIVVEVPSGDTLIVQLKGIGRRRVRLAGLQAPQVNDPMAAVSRFHLASVAKGLRVFVVLEPQGKHWPEEVVAVVEDFAEVQLAAGLGRFLPEEGRLLGAYVSCRCMQAEARVRQGRVGIWTP